jgi:hypothetical protein
VPAPSFEIVPVPLITPPSACVLPNAFVVNVCSVGKLDVEIDRLDARAVAEHGTMERDPVSVESIRTGEWM